MPYGNPGYHCLRMRKWGGGSLAFYSIICRIMKTGMVNYEQIEKLVTDPQFQELKYSQERGNVFTVVGQTHTEHWHSSFIKWLLDPYSSLRLGRFPLERLLMLYLIKKEKETDSSRTDEGDQELTLEDVYRFKLENVEFCTEKDAAVKADGDAVGSPKASKRSIDVFGESQELLIIIENKVNARENYNRSEEGQVGQTADYYNYGESQRGKRKALYFFITADQNQESSSDEFVHISYQEMFDHIISKCIAHPQVSEEGKYLLEQYASNLRENIRNTQTPMALVNMDLCRLLYEKHRDVLDGIYEAVNHERGDIQKSPELPCVAYCHYKKIFDEIYLSLQQFERTPKGDIKRQRKEIIGLEELSEEGSIKDGMKLYLDYDSDKYYGVCVLRDGQMLFKVLDEKGRPYTDENENAIGGCFNNTRSAAVFAINMRRKLLGKKDRVKHLERSIQWKNEKGESILDMIERSGGRDG